MKTKVNLSIDVDLWELAKAKGVNVSGVCNTYLKQYLNIDETKVPKEKDLLIEKRAELTAEANLVDSRIRKFKKEEEEEQRKKSEADRIEQEAIRRGDVTIL